MILVEHYRKTFRCLSFIRRRLTNIYTHLSVFLALPVRTTNWHYFALFISGVCVTLVHIPIIVNWTNTHRLALKHILKAVTVYLDILRYFRIDDSFTVVHKPHRNKPKMSNDNLFGCLTKCKMLDHYETLSGSL